MSSDAAQLVTFDFHGDALDVVPGEGRAHVVIKRVCEALGLGFGSQLQRLKSDSAITVTMIVTVAADGKSREVACIDVRQLPLWLAKIHASKVSAAARPKLVLYQREAGEVLANHFLGRRGGASDPAELIEARARVVQLEAEIERERAANRLLMSSDSSTISESEQAAILAAIGDAARFRAERGISRSVKSARRRIMNRAVMPFWSGSIRTIPRDGTAAHVKLAIERERTASGKEARAKVRVEQARRAVAHAVEAQKRVTKRARAKVRTPGNPAQQELFRVTH